MKNHVKKFFLLGLGIAAAGVAAGAAVKYRKQIKKALGELVAKKKILKQEAITLEKEFVAEIQKIEKKVAGKKPAKKK